MTRRVPELTLLSIVALVAFAVRLQQLGDQSLWLDEALSVVFASRPLPELIRLLATEDIHPPLYPFLLHYWMIIAGDGEFATRFISVFSGVAMVPLIYVTGKRLELLAYPKSTPTISLAGLAGALLAASSSFYISYSQETRSYMSLTLVGLLSSYLLLRALPSSDRRIWIAYAVATTAALYTHYTAFLLVAFHALFVALARGSYGRVAWRRWSICALAVGIAYLPWLGYALGQVQRISDYWPGTLQLAAVLRASLLQFVAGSGESPRRMLLPTLVGLGLLGLGLLSLMVGGSRRRPAQHTLFLLLYLVVPAALLYAIAYNRPKFDPRYLLIVTPAFYLTLAWGIAALLRAARSRGLPLLLRVAIPSIGVAALVGGVLVSAVYGEPPRVKGDYRSLVSYVESHSRPGDAVVLMMNAYHPYVYYSELQIPWYPMEPFDDFDGAIIRLNRLAEQHRRLWFILWQQEWADPADYVMHVMEDQATEVQLDSSFAGLGLRLFELTPGSRFSYYPRISHKVEAIFGKKMEFWAWNASPSEAVGGSSIQFDLHWLVLQEIQQDLKVVLALVDGDRHVWARVDEVMATPAYPSSRWKKDALIHDRHRLDLPAGIPPGDYEVELHVYDPATLKELNVTRWSGADLGTTLSLGRLAVKPTPAEARPATGAPQARWDLGSDRLELLTSQVSRGLARPGESIELTLLWRAPTAPAAEYAVRIALLDSTGSPTAAQSYAAVPGYPTSRWREGELVLAKYWLPLPATLSPGKYAVAAAPALGREDSVPSLRYAQLSTLWVEAVPAIFELPPMQATVEARLGGKVELAGYDLDDSSVRPGGTLRLTLYWRALDSMERSYKVFNHVIDEHNVFAGQRDAVPAGYSRPTTTWRKGEVLEDRYEIPISRDAKPGPYLLKVGMYSEEDGQRLPVVNADASAGGDSITLTTIQVVP